MIISPLSFHYLTTKKKSHTRIDSIDLLKDRLEGFRNEIIDPDAFKQFYAFVFDYAKDEKKTQIPVQVATELWKMFPKDHFQFLDLWFEFLATETMNQVGITKDVWNMFLAFCQKHDHKMSNYDSNACWPTYIDNVLLHFAFFFLEFFLNNTI